MVPLSSLATGVLPNASQTIADKKAWEELCADFEPLSKLMKEILGDKVEKVRAPAAAADGELYTNSNCWKKH